MKLLFAAIFVLIQLSAVSSQPPSRRTNAVNPAATASPAVMSEDDRWKAASALTDPKERARAIAEFVTDFPESARLAEAHELLAAARGDAANSMLAAGDTAGAVSLLKTAVEETPSPFSAKIFTEVISKFPGMLYASGEPVGAFEVADAIEKRAATASELFTLANFHLATENGGAAVRLATKALELEPGSSGGYQILGMAHRLNFDLESSKAAYGRSLELAPDSVTAKRSLAELRRATGDAAGALELFRSVLAETPDDAVALNGEVLSLFDLGKKAEAEAAFDKAMKANPGNVSLLAGVANWYAANGDGPNAVLHANEAIDIEPRFVWGYIALGRGLMLEKKYAEAEQALVRARKHGRFPTLEYDLALARVASGFYRDAAEGVRGVFEVKDGEIVTRLGGRVEKRAATFTDLLADERRASIFEPRSFQQRELSEQLANLIALDGAAQAGSAETAAEAAMRFANGNDPMQLYRQLYAASVLLENKMAADRALELTRAAVTRVDDGLQLPNASTAVMAAELYDSRRIAFGRDQFVVVPEVPRNTLSMVVRGRIEETAGWSLSQQQRYEDAEIRLRRAITVLPKDSAWWRSSMWKLGTVQEQLGKHKEALESYTASYVSQPGSGSQYLTIRSVYLKLNGNTDDLAALVGPSPIPELTDNMTAATAVSAPEEPAVGQPEKPVQPEPVKVETETPVDPEPEKAETETPVEAAPVISETETPAEPEPARVETEIPVDPQPENETETPVDTEPEPVKPEPETPVEPEPEKVETEILPNPEPEAAKLETETPLEPEPAVTLPETPEPPTVEEAIVEQPAAIKEEIPVAIPAPETVTPEPEPAASPVEEVTEKPAVKSPVSEKPIPTGTKSLFDPVIITVPGRTTRKRTEDTSAAATPTQTDDDGSTRKRQIDGAVEPVTPCTVNVSQSNVSLLNTAGSVIILVGTGDSADIRELAARSSSPADVEVTAEPEIEGIIGRTLYQIRSKSTRTGVYQVTFQLPCGKKDVTVTVR